MNFEHVVAGDIVTRLLAEEIPIKLRVTSTDDRYIYCGPPGKGWKFLRSTGAEVDEELGWDGVHITGSRLIATMRDEST